MSTQTESNQQAQIAAGLRHFFVNQYYNERQGVTPDCLDAMYNDAMAFADTQLNDMLQFETGDKPKKSI